MIRSSYAWAAAAIAAALLAGCAPIPDQGGWVILADEHRDSRCRIVNVDEANAILGRGGYRVQKNFVTRYAYIYSVEPLTDLRRCFETGFGGGQ